MPSADGFFLLRPKVAASLLIGLGSLVLYSITMAPDILAQDSSDWQAAAATLGISHAPGSPTYTIIGYLFTLAPVGNLAARVTFLSVVMGAAGVVAVFVFVLMLLDSWLSATVSAATLAVSSLWWAHASVATPYNAVPTVMAVMFILLLLWRRKGDVRLVWGMALLFGFSLGYHLTIIYFLPAVVLGLAMLGPWRKLLKLKPFLITVLLFAAGISVFLYLPIRSAADPPIRYSSIDSLSSLYNFVTASAVREGGHGSIQDPDINEIKDWYLRVIRDSYYPSYTYMVFLPLFILLYPQIWPVLRRRKTELLYLFAAMVVNLAVLFSTRGTYLQYYLPLLLYFSILAGFSIYLVKQMVEKLVEKKQLRLVCMAIFSAIYLIAIGTGVPHAWDYADHSDNVSMRTYVDGVFSEAAQGAVVIASWESYTGLKYAQEVEGQRPDIELIPVATNEWLGTAAEVRATKPSQILLSHTVPLVVDVEFDMKDLDKGAFVSIKGRTYQDRSHGEPYPAYIGLFEIR